MRQAADILASKAAMQIRYLEAMQSMAKSSNSKVIFMPSASGLNQRADKFTEPQGNDLHKDTSAGASDDPSMFGSTNPSFQQVTNASMVERI